MGEQAARRSFVDGRVDSWLVGWLAVAVWAGALLLPRAGIHFSDTLFGPVYWAGAAITAAHFGLSYHLAYGRGEAGIRERPLLLGVAPAVLFAALAVLVALTLTGGADAVSRSVTWAITSVYLLTTWHYIKQVYGIARLAASYAGAKLSAGEWKVLRYGLYPLWAVGAGQVLVQGTNYSFGGYLIGFSVLPEPLYLTLRVAALVAAVPVAVVLWRTFRRESTMPGTLLAPYVAAFLWLGAAPSPALTILFLAPFHALQYLAVGHRAEIAMAAAGSQPRGAIWWLNIFAGATCGGFLLGRWLPDLLDSHVARGGPLLFTAAFFVFLNLHHYLVDAAIWRSGGQIVRTMAKGPAPAIATAPSLQPTHGR
jgi:hypothetical protein